jgi:predicted metal-dependent hydrolase
MFLFNKKPETHIRNLVIADKNITIKIHTENRTNSRVSLTKTGINIRLPLLMKKERQEQQIEHFLEWAKDQFLKKQHLFEPKKRLYEANEVLHFYDQNYMLNILEATTNTVSGRIEKESITIKMPHYVTQENKQKHLSKIIILLLKKHYKPKIEKRLHELNQQFHFGQINKLTLKNNSSNWGSCSSKNNINISVRILFAPVFVVEYLLIHELSHLRHRNHSKAFWALVAHCCPRYQEAEKWLNEHGASCII